MLPGQAYRGDLNVAPSQPGMWSDEDEARLQANDAEAKKRTLDIAGLIMGGSYAAPAVKNSIGMGVRSLPTENYPTNISKYTKDLYRETSPEAALEVLPGSNVSAGLVGGMHPRHFYADTPELALGQHGNKGVRVGYDSNAFEGQINQSKPGWDYQFQQGYGEYLAQLSRDANIQSAVKSINVDKAALESSPRWVRNRFNHIVEKLKTDGWEAKDTKEYLDLIRNYGLVGGAALGLFGFGQNNESQ